LDHPVKHSFFLEGVEHERNVNYHYREVNHEWEEDVL